MYGTNNAITTAGLKIKEHYRPDEVGRILSCSISTIYRLIKSGTLAARRLGGTNGHYRISRTDLGEYLTSSLLDRE